MTSSEDKYWIADTLYDRIKDNFYEIENEDVLDKEELIEKTIEDAEAALEVIDKINLNVIKKLYPENIYIITKNVNKFKEQADYVLAALNKMKKHEAPVKYRHPLPPEMWPDEERKEWEEQIKKRREGGTEDTREEFDILGESFISLSEYKKIKSKCIE